MSQAISTNFLSPLGYRLVLARAPHLTYFLQECELPGLTLGKAERPTPFVVIPEAGDHVVFEEFTLQFRVDEDLRNWEEIFSWMQSLGFPEDYSQYRRLANKEVTDVEKLKSDIDLIVTTNAKNPNVKFTFKDAFPTFLSSMRFTTTDAAVNYIIATVTFTYTYYTFERL